MALRQNLDLGSLILMMPALRTGLLPGEGLIATTAGSRSR